MCQPTAWLIPSPVIPGPAPWSEPILDLLDAIKMGSIFPDAPVSASFVSHIWKIIRPGSQFDWADAQPAIRCDRGRIVVREAAVDSAPCTVVESSQLCGGQVHFYMETQACVAIPLDEGRMLVHPSTQSPMEMHDTVGHGAGRATTIRWKSRYRPSAAASAARPSRPVLWRARRPWRPKPPNDPVRLAMPRDEDTAMIGKRHAYYGQYQIAIDARYGRAPRTGAPCTASS